MKPVIVYVHGEQEIIKLQRPLDKTTMEPVAGQPILAYTQGKFLTTLLDSTPELLTFFGNRKKIYVRGLLGDRKISIDKVVENQPW